MVYSNAVTTVSPNYANETLNGGEAGPGSTGRREGVPGRGLPALEAIALIAGRRYNTPTHAHILHRHSGLWLKCPAPHTPPHSPHTLSPPHYTGAAGWLKSTLAAPGVQVKYSGVLNGIGALILWGNVGTACLHPLPALPWCLLCPTPPHPTSSLPSRRHLSLRAPDPFLP